ncbi:MAG: cytochrome c oxidase, subunit, partial [Acidimicrobiia bacterium]|nr:cytochrome c oxidase, subunit [Acidimicrobiia bacterium]
DQAITDSYFVVAHFHYVLIGGSVMPILAGVYFWYPKVTGRMMTRHLGKLAFWLIFVGFHVTFFVQHILGIVGMPRRVYTYDRGLGWDWMNLVSSIGSFVLALGFLMVTADLIISWRRNVPAPPNPWGAETLEWSVSSPPPDYNFAGFPIVSSRDPMWDLEPGQSLVTITEVDGRSLLHPHGGHHETLVTSVLDANEMEVTVMPPPAYWPLLLAFSLLVLSTATLTRNWVVGMLGGLLAVYSFFRWHREAS